MERRHHRYVSKRFLLRRVGCLLLILSCCPPSTTASTTTTTTTTTATTNLDLSYLHRTKSSILADAIRATISEQQQQTLEDDGSIVDIDISASMIGKDIQDLISSLLDTAHATVVSRKINLTARGNQWRPEDASKLFQAIVGPLKRVIVVQCPIPFFLNNDLIAAIIIAAIKCLKCIHFRHYLCTLGIIAFLSWGSCISFSHVLPYM
jgi:hypothetical protein